MWTLRLAPAAIVIGWPASVSCWLPSAPLIANEPKSNFEPSMTQWTGVPPLPPGRASLRVTPLAVPAPVLLTVTVNPIGSPALTESASADLATWICGLRHSMVAEAWIWSWFVACAVAVFGYVEQAWAAVVAVTWTLADAPGAMS